MSRKPREKVVQHQHRDIQERIPDPEEYGPGKAGYTPFAKFLLVVVIVAAVIAIAAMMS